MLYTIAVAIVCSYAGWRLASRLRRRQTRRLHQRQLARAVDGLWLNVSLAGLASIADELERELWPDLARFRWPWVHAAEQRWGGQ